MSDREIICCPKCGQKLRIPSELGTLKVSCPTCGESFSWDKVSGISSEKPIEPSPPKSKRGTRTKIRGKSMNPKIQMRIGHWGAITFFVLWFLPFIFGPPASHVRRLSTLFTLGILVCYIGGIESKKITTARTAFRVWWISYGVVGLATLFLELHGESDFQSVLIEFLPLTLFYGFMTLIMWTGLRGLKRIIEAESELDKSPTSDTMSSDLDKTLANNATVNVNEPKWPGIVLLIILLVIAGFIPQNAWWGRILFYIVMGLVVGCLCIIFPFMRKLIFGKSNRL